MGSLADVLPLRTPHAQGGEEWELRLRERTVRAGVLLTWAVCAALAVYYATTWRAPNRPLMTALLLVAVASGGVIELLPTARIVRSRWRELFFLSWSLLEVGLLLLLLLLDGGASSAVAALLVVPMVFVGVSYPPRYVVVVGAVSVLGSAAVAAVARDLPAGQLLLFVTGLALTATMSAWHARNHCEQRRQLAALSRTDPLTGALNRRGFEERLDLELLSAGHHARPLALVLVDLDDFKIVNDTDGHAAGDRLLRAVTAALADAVRPVDTVARLGGDEFAIVLPGAEPPRLPELLGRLHATVAAQNRASFGAALFPRDGTGREELLRRADLRLYDHKARRAEDRLAAGR